MGKKRKQFVLVMVGFFALSVSGFAQTWSSTQQVTWNSRNSVIQDFGIDSLDTLHVIWKECLTPSGIINMISNLEIYYKRSTDGGNSWGVTKRLTWNLDQSGDARMAIDSLNRLHVVWEDWTPGSPQIFYKTSTNAGVTWGTAKRLTWSSNGFYNPAITVDSNNTIHILFMGGNFDFESYYKKSTDGGVSWTGATRLTWTTGNTQNQTIAAGSPNSIYAGWIDSTPGNPEIYLKKSINSGTTWGSPQRLTWTFNNENNPMFAVDGSNNVHLIYIKFLASNAELFFRKSLNGGVSWSSPKRLTWTSGWSVMHDYSFDSNQYIHLAWVEEDSSGNREVYYKNSKNGGTTWSASKRLTWNPTTSDYPMLAIDSNDDIHLVWNDRKSGTTQIYYKKGIQLKFLKVASLRH